MSDYAIKVEHIDKVYRLYDKPTDRLKDVFGLKKKEHFKEHYALHDVSFNVKKGESVGIIGTNGSGKSTILKIITGVLSPTAGDVTVDGRISALLELGAGFNMEYSGIENIYLNGTMMGYSKEEVDERMEEILDFADIGDFVYQPVKTYSSGMFVRLAFAVAINIDPEILIVDEALSVGDVFFQAKCYKKFEEFQKMGKTILFVSHDMGSIAQYCDRAVLIDRGRKLMEGSTKEVIEVYKKVLVKQYTPDGELARQDQDAPVEMKQNMVQNPDFIEYGDGRAKIIDYGVVDAEGNMTNTVLKKQDFAIHMKVKFLEDIEEPIFAFCIKDLKGNDLSGTNTQIEKTPVGAVKSGQEIEIDFRQKMILQPGQYLLQLGCTGYENGNLVVYHRLYNVCSIQVIADKITTGYFDMDSTVTCKEVKL